MANDTLAGKATVLVDSLPDKAADSSIYHDPVILQLTWAVALVTLIIAVGKPLKDYLRNEKREAKVDKVQDAKTDAETVLYTHLSEQVSQYRKIADQAFRERNDLITRVALLESKAEDLIESKTIIDKLKDRLDKKDEEIRLLLAQAAEERKQFLEILRSKENEISKRDERILVLEQGLRDLELRQAKGESERHAFVCPLQPVPPVESDELL